MLIYSSDSLCLRELTNAGTHNYARVVAMFGVYPLPGPGCGGCSPDSGARSQGGRQNTEGPCCPFPAIPSMLNLILIQFKRFGQQTRL